MRAISLKLPEALIERIDGEAKARKVTKSSVIRQSLEQTLRTPSKAASCFDLASDLAGSIKGASRDLAHNPRYLDGFGETTGKKP